MESVNSEGKKLPTKRELWKMRCIPVLGAQHMAGKRELRDSEIEAKDFVRVAARIKECVMALMLLAMAF